MMQRITVLIAILVLAGCVTTEQRRFPPPVQGSGQPGAEPRPEAPANNRPQNKPPRQEQAPQTETPQTKPPTGPTAGSAEQSKPAGQAPKTLPPRSADEASSPAVRSLLGRADTLARNGNMEMASATLERALDLSPRNPFIYQRLAAVKLSQDRAEQAEAMARKSNSLAGDNPFLRTGNWRLIAEARRASGDESGASKASARAKNYHRTSLQMQQ